MKIVVYIVCHYIFAHHVFDEMIERELRSLKNKDWLIELKNIYIFFLSYEDFH